MRDVLYYATAWAVLVAVAVILYLLVRMVGDRRASRRATEDAAEAARLMRENAERTKAILDDHDDSDSELEIRRRRSR